MTSKNARALHREKKNLKHSTELSAIT
jgi:hypothetical protein